MYMVTTNITSMLKFVVTGLAYAWMKLTCDHLNPDNSSWSKFWTKIQQTQTLIDY
jgi:hypothetical protein